VEGACNRFALWRAHAIGLPCGGRMQSVCPVEGGDVTHEGIRGAVRERCVATSRANCTEYWAPSSPVCRVNEGRARGCMGGADVALWARIALCGWRGSASFGHPPRQGGVGGPEIVIDRRAEPRRCIVCGGRCDSDARGVLARSSTDCGERSGLEVLGLFCKSGAAADGREPRSSPHDVRSRFPGPAASREHEPYPPAPQGAGAVDEQRSRCGTYGNNTSNTKPTESQDRA
jgi:hypothetical protein